MESEVKYKVVNCRKGYVSYVGQTGVLKEKTKGGFSLLMGGMDYPIYFHEDEVEEIKETSPKTPFDTQVGGSHYKDMAIQPTEYILKNNMGFAEGNVIKYVSRYKAKGGLQDLQKARHYLDMLIASEETK